MLSKEKLKSFSFDPKINILNFMSSCEEVTAARKPFSCVIFQITSSSTKKLWDNKSDIKNTGPLAPLQMPGSNEHQMWSKEHQGVWPKEQQMWSTQDNNSSMIPRRNDNTMTGILR